MKRIVNNSDYSLSKYTELPPEDIDFIITFLRHYGDFKEIQREKGMLYPAVKNRISEVLQKLGIEESDKVVFADLNTSLILARIEDNDSPIVARIKEKLNECGGKATIKLLRGDDCDIWFSSNGRGLISPKIPPANQLVWEVFDAAVEVVLHNGGKALKGNARSGAKLGIDLPLNSVEGYIAQKVHGVKIGETAFGPGFVIAAVLDWVGICSNERGYLSIKPDFHLHPENW